MFDDGSPSPTLNKDACQALGRLLSAARAEQHRSPDQIKARLLLSSAQLTGLEQGDCKAFWTPLFFEKAMRKYAALLGVTSQLLDEVLAIVPPIAAPPPDSRFARLAAGPLIAVVLVVCLIGGSVAVYYSGRQQVVAPSAVPAPRGPAIAPVPVASGQPAPLPAARSAVPATPATSAEPPAVPTESVASSPTPTPDRGHVIVAQASWVFVRYADGTTVERTLEPVQALALTEWPVYLAVGAIGDGDADGVRFVWGDRAIDVAPFTNGNEVRIPSAQLAAMAPDGTLVAAGPASHDGDFR
ncbi:MAG: helix-turn-helix domain-containing protein [Acidobacteria bacterium]|nr:helix-turn-helix domain-containing protein [Acidobacteriota bacterium]